MPKITLNGNEHEIADSISLLELLKLLGIPAVGTAIAVNGSIVSRDQHENHMVQCKDKIDVIRAIGGG